MFNMKRFLTVFFIISCLFLLFGCGKTANISSDKAERIAVRSAGLSLSDALYLKTNLGYDEGKPVYLVSFRSGKTDYIFKLDADDGSVMKYTKKECIF